MKKVTSNFNRLRDAYLLASIAVACSPAFAQLEKAIEAKDPVRFAKAYDGLSHACSACHQDTGHGFIEIQRPTTPPLTNQRFKLDR